MWVDTTNIEAMEAGLKAHNNSWGQPVINSIDATEARMEKMIPMVAKYNTKMVALLYGVDGIPRDENERGLMAADLLMKTMEAGIPAEDIFYDPIVVPVSSQQNQVVACTAFMEMLGDIAPGAGSTCGLSNISNGSPEELRHVLNHAYVIMLKHRGMSSAILAAGRLLSLMQDGRELGIRVSADVYPYVASCTELSAIVSQGSEIPLTGESALEAANRRRGEIRQAIDDRGGAKRLLVVGCPGDRGLEGMTLAAIAKRKHVDVEVIVDGLIEQGDAIVASHSMREEDLIVFLSDERTCIGTDGYAVSIDAGWNQASFHPRSFGAFPRYLARYVRELKTTTLEQAIHRMTGLPADVFGVQGRGRIAEGLAADLVIFDPDRIVDEATFEAPRAYPRGIEYVMVNGTWVVADGTATDETPGDVLERKTGG